VYHSSSSKPCTRCTNLVWHTTVPVSGDGQYSSNLLGASFTPNAPGYYYWTADYSGDSNNNAYSTPCGASGETLVVTSCCPPPCGQGPCAWNRPECE